MYVWLYLIVSEEFNKSRAMVNCDRTQEITAVRLMTVVLNTDLYFVFRVTRPTINM